MTQLQAQAGIALDPISIGGLQVMRVVDTVEHFSPRIILKDITYDHLEPHLDWLLPHFLDQSHKLLLPVQSFVFRTRHHTVMIDSCVGNGKRSGFSQWNNRQGPFLADLAAAGFPPESIDYVFCTHMHVDHAGWNTQRRDGRWVPTFPNARYLFKREEFDFWEAREEEVFRYTMQDSILPVVEAGQVEWVEKDHAIGDEVFLEPTPGHTPGHSSVHLVSQGKEGVITGDVIVNPVEIAEPHWGQVSDWDRELAIRTRIAFIEKYTDTDVMILGSHFAGPTGVHIVSTPEGRRIRIPQGETK